jgi:hypothetical protein
MSWIAQALKELWGLFVEDGSYAAAVLVWTAIVALVLSAALPVAWRGPCLFLGLVLVLIENVARSARKLRKP